jgi:tetratricopeptide (TPR) repeat protein
VIGISILVLAFLLIPFTLWATRSARRRPRWKGIDWSRGRPDDIPEEELAARAANRHRAGELDAALADYDLALARGGPDADTLNNRACLHRERGDLERALADVRAALALDAESATAHVTHAEVLAQRGELDEALAALRRAIEIDATWRDHACTAESFANLRTARGDDPVFGATRRL